MASPAQITANQNNATLSTGPRTEEGKQTASRNNFRHGLASSQLIIEGESIEEFNALRDALIEEHQPATPTETALVTGMAQHYWLAQRAIGLQTAAFTSATEVDATKLSLYLRYQGTHDRQFHKCLNDLLKLRAQKRREQIGFESQQQKQALNEAKIRALTAKAEAAEIDTEIRSTIEAPLPGNLRIPFDTMKSVFEAAVREVSHGV
jgi:hypothetical protein